jgi:hypothetical protein
MMEKKFSMRSTSLFKNIEGLNIATLSKIASIVNRRER